MLSLKLCGGVQCLAVGVLLMGVLGFVLYGCSQVSQSGVAQKITNSNGLSFMSPGGWIPGEKKVVLRSDTFLYSFVPMTDTSGKSGNILAFLRSPGAPNTARSLLDAAVVFMKETIKNEVRTQEVRSIGGMTGMWLENSGMGTGAAMLLESNVPTSQIWVFVPRENNIVGFLITGPDAKFPELKKVFQDLLQSLTLTGQQSAEQKESK